MIELLSKITETVVGIDPGLSGAVVRLEPGGKLTASPPFGCLRDIHEACKKLIPGAVRVAVEFVHSRPGEGVASVFSFGKSTGTAFGSVYSFHEPEPVEVHPVSWQNWIKKLLGIAPKTYFGSITCQTAEKVFPAFRGLFYGPRGGKRDGIADAAFIALWTALNPQAKGVLRA